MKNSHTIHDFLGEDFSREIVIKYHVSGFRVLIKDSDYGEVTFATGGGKSFEGAAELIADCINKFSDNIKSKEAEKIRRLALKKKEIQKELEEISRELTEITLSKFESA